MKIKSTLSIVLVSLMLVACGGGSDKPIILSPTTTTGNQTTTNTNNASTNTNTGTIGGNLGAKKPTTIPLPPSTPPFKG